MKISTRKMTYEEVMKLPRLKHKKPMKPSRLLAAIVRIVCAPTLKKIGFTHKAKNLIKITHYYLTKITKLNGMKKVTF